MLALLLALALCQDQIEKWVLDLDSDSIEVRAEAEKQLRALDGAKLEQVRKVAPTTFEGKARLDQIVVVLAQKVTLSARIKSYPTVTAEYKDTPFPTVLNDLRKLGVDFTGTLEDGLKLTASFKDAPVMQVIDTLATTAKIQWMWHNTGVIWMSNGLLRGGPAVYDHGFRVRLRAVGTDRLTNFEAKSQITRFWVDLVAEPKIEYVAPTVMFNDPDGSQEPIYKPCTLQWGLDMAQPLILPTDKLITKASISGKARVLFQVGPNNLKVTSKEPLKHKAYELTFGKDESHHITIVGPAKEWLAEHVANLVVIDNADVEYGATIHNIHYPDEGTCKIYFGCQTYDMKAVKLIFYDEVLEHFIPFEFKDIELP